MLKGIAQYERAHGIWSAFLDDLARAETDKHWLRSKAWSGVISRHTSAALVENCHELGIPLVDVKDDPPIPGVPKIRPDNVAIGHLGAEHFLDRGFRHFAFSGLSSEHWSCERRDGFCEAVQLAGFDCDVFDVIWPGEMTPQWDEQQLIELRSWLTKLPKPVGIMGCHDLRALQVLSAAQSAGLQIPEDVAVLGANNDAVRCDLPYPQLSSVATNGYLLGCRAAETLDRLMRGESVDQMDVRIQPVGVVTRHSTEVLAIPDKNVVKALRLIREGACNGLTVGEVVKQCAASRSQLERKFRHYLGRSLQAEIRNVQLTRIKQLLLETDYPLKKIAELTGFEHPEYMSVVFKRLTRESPGGYRSKHQMRAGDHDTAKLGVGSEE